MHLIYSLLVYQVSLISLLGAGVAFPSPAFGVSPVAFSVTKERVPSSVPLVAVFLDVPQGYWAQDFITPLVNRNILQGFPDGRFRPSQLMTRAEFAALLVQFPWVDWMPWTGGNPDPFSATFNDVSPTHWAAPSIEQVAQWGLMQGDPEGNFRPQQPISRMEALLTLSKGVSHEPLPNLAVLSAYHDRFVIPPYAQKTIALATQHHLVVTYPDPRFLSPNRLATRAEVCAFLHQLLVYHGELRAIDSPYISQR